MKTRIFVLTIALFSISFLQAQWDEPGNGVIHTTDKVGIGITSPIVPFHLFQNDWNGMRFQRAGHDTYDLGLRGSKGLHFLNQTSGVYEMVFDGNGNIGIGTTTPASPLHVLQNTARGLRLERDGHKNYELMLAGSKGLHIHNIDNNSYEMVFDGNGNVGIGTLIPNSKLHVNGTLTVGNDGDNSRIKIECR